MSSRSLSFIVGADSTPICRAFATTLNSPPFGSGGLALHAGGRIYEYRALITRVRINEYVRVSPVIVRGEGGSRGTAGALSQLFERVPTLAAWLQLLVNRQRLLREQDPH
jgi:hypothetical protein